MLVRPATEVDLAAVKAIYDREVRVGVATFDLVEPPLEHWCERQAHSAPGDHLVVATDGEEVLGYATSASYRPRPAYDRTRETSVYVAATAQGRGVGRALYADLLDRLRADGVHLVIAVVALPNEASTGLHAAFGFQPVGLLPEVGHKHGRWVDTELYALRLV